jgi:hypothetical protein
MSKSPSPVRGLLALALLVGTSTLAGCGITGGTGTGAASSPTATAAAPTAATTATPTPNGLSGYPIKVYFSNNPGTTSVAPVNRVSPTAQVAVFSVQLLIAGPTPEERAQGLFSELNDAFAGPSTCTVGGSMPVDGPDFTLTLNMKGKTPEQGTATLQFCRPTQLPGEGTGLRIGAEIDATLKQFPGVTKVVILNQSGNCWSGTDLSGQNKCLQ